MNHTNFRLDTLNFAASAFINTTTAAGFYVTSKGKRLQGSVSIHTRKNLPLPIFTYLRSRLAGKRIKRHLESSILLVETDNGVVVSDFVVAHFPTTIDHSILATSWFFTLHGRVLPGAYTSAYPYSIYWPINNAIDVRNLIQEYARLANQWNMDPVFTNLL